MNKAENNLLIAASGTGGHIFPALTIAEEVSDWKITWLGIKSRCEIDLVPKKYSLLMLDFETPSKKNIFLFLQYLRIIFATFKVLKIINQRKISLIFTTGGYISAPTIIAAKISNIPIIIHESNLVPGLVTKYFGRFCDYVLTGFKDTDKYLRQCRISYTGTPLRKQFYISNKLPDWVPLNQEPLILIMGGSQGATSINKMFYYSLDLLLKKNIRIVHIIGNNENIDLNIKNKNYVRRRFVNNIAALMQNCDLVISRSGAGAINELIYTQKPSILIPFPNSKNNHQEKNALILSALGGAILINQNLNSKKYLKDTLERIFENERNSLIKSRILHIMKENMSCLNTDDPKKKIIKILNQFRNDL